MMKYVFVFFFLASISLCILPDTEKKSPLYTYDGVCESPNCVPNTSPSYAGLWSRFSMSTRRDKLNEYIKKNSNIFSNKIEVKINPDGILKLYSKEFLNATEIMGNYSDFNCILFDTNIHSHHFKPGSKLRDYKFPQLKVPNVNTKTVLNFFTNVLIHLFNYKQSNFEIEMLMLPEPPLNLPVITLTTYEKGVLKDRDIESDFEKYRERLRYYYDEFVKAIDDTFSTDEKQLAFGKQLIDLNDFAYAFNIGWMRLTSKSFVPFLFLNNFNHTKSEVLGFEEEDRNGVGEYRVMANRNYSEGEEISFAPEENENTYYLMYNLFGDMEVNTKDCISVYVLDEESGKKLVLHENHPRLSIIKFRL